MSTLFWRGPQWQFRYLIELSNRFPVPWQFIICKILLFCFTPQGNQLASIIEMSGYFFNFKWSSLETSKCQLYHWNCANKFVPKKNYWWRSQKIHLYFNLGKERLKIRKTHFINGFRNHSKILQPFTYINIFCMWSKTYSFDSLTAFTKQKRLNTSSVETTLYHPSRMTKLRPFTRPVKKTFREWI